MFIGKFLRALKTPSSFVISIPFQKMPRFSSTFSFFFIFNLPCFILCTDDYRYSNCSVPFNCGIMISYPFWANNQAEYCGYPGFRVECVNGSPIILIKSRPFNVLEMKPDTESLILAETGWWNWSNCPLGTEDYHIYLDQTPFSFSDSVNRNITLFYDCPPLRTELPNKFQCNYNDKSTDAWIAVDPYLPTPNNPELLKCNGIIIIPLLRTAFSKFNPVELELKEVLKIGFEAKYSVNASICNECERSGGQCGYDKDKKQPECYCPGGPYQRSCPNGNAPKKNMAIIVAVARGILVTVLATIVTCCLRKKSNTSVISWKNKKGNTKAIEDFFKDCELLAPKGYKYKDIKKMTNSFQDNIGQGGFGTKGDGNDFINEVACIGRTSHVNIVTLLGFCIDGRKRALVYEFMPNGSLEKFIYGERPLQTRHLGWEALYKVAIGIARGLEYLHRGCNTRIVHFDIKPHNILLDENFIPKISDFGLSKLSNVAQSLISMTGARGTAGYIAPELFSRSIGEVSHKSDVYSYGMMVLEMVGGRKNIDVRVTNISEIYFPHWIHKRLDMNEDLGLHGVTNLEDQRVARKMILVGLWCIQLKPASRPPMNKVLEMLEGNLEALQFPPKPYLSSPPNENEGSHSSI